jgi:lysophospholipase L1-like esterase
MLAYGGTLLPFNGFSDYTSARDQIRQEINNWIRSTSTANGGFDAVIDFDATLRDPNDTSRLSSTYDSGDHLHPGPQGYQKIGETINLNLLTE